MKKALIAIAALISANAIADCATGYDLALLKRPMHFRFEVDRLDETLHAARKSPDHPPLDRDPAWRIKFGQNPVVPNASRPEDLRRKGESSEFLTAAQRLTYWQNEIFGGPEVMNLVPAQEGFPETDVWFKAIHFDPLFSRQIKAKFDSNALEIIDFVLVHEIMHYVYDLFADRNDHRSCHGFPGYLLNDENDPSAENEKLLLKAYKHAEIDALAIRVLESRGISPLPALEFLKRTYETYGPSMPEKYRIDPQVRISLMKARVQP